MMTPRTARTMRELVSLERDNYETKDGWIIVDGFSVTVAAQESGKSPTGIVKLNRRTFNALIDWYNREQGKSRNSAKLAGVRWK